MRTKFPSRSGTQSQSLYPCLLGLVAALLVTTQASATVVNGNFDSGLSGWTVTGDVTATAEATLSDATDGYAALYQPLALAPGQYRIEFDVLGLLSSDLSADPNAFPDTLFASLYFINDLSSFDLAGAVFDDSAALLDLDASGPLYVAGTLSQSALGPDWMHLSFDFQNQYSYVVPVFELVDFNYLSGDSAASVDNVSITATGVVPEPSSLVVLALGVGGLFVRRRPPRSVA